MATAEKLITVQQWLLLDESGRSLRSFTASWCAPCTRIKPCLNKLEACKAIHLIGTVGISKADIRPGMLIPFFQLVDENNTIVRSIQTSKEEELRQFILGDDGAAGDMGRVETGAVV